MIGRPAVDCFADAQALLAANNLTCSQVLSVDRDSILYRNGLGKARTVWIHRTARGTLRVWMQPGFIAEPPAGWHDESPAGWHDESPAGWHDESPADRF